MSKVDAQRALREARYARYAAAKKSEAVPAKKAAKEPAAKTAAAKTPTTKAAKDSKATLAVAPASEELFGLPATGPEPAETADLAADQTPGVAEPAAEESVKVEEAVAVEVDAVDEGLCGHRSMNGRSCTRVKGHEQKSHRYS
jgi:hypothetical protein